MKELITFILTVLGGVAVYTIGQITVEFFIKPIHALKNIIGAIDASLIYCAKVYSNELDAHDEETLKETSEKLRMLASDLSAKANAVPWYSLFVKFNVIPEKTQIDSAVKNLIGLSNFQAAEKPIDNEKLAELIRADLRPSRRKLCPTFSGN